MQRKKKLAVGLLCAVLAAALAVPAYACGGHGHHRARQVYQTQISLCSVEDCALSGRHIHDGTVYCGFAHTDGYCSGACCALCPVEGCELTGRHVHDSVTYCGGGHEAGFCGGGCAVSTGWSRCHRG